MLSHATVLEDISTGKISTDLKSRGYLILWGQVVGRLRKDLGEDKRFSAKGKSSTFIGDGGVYCLIGSTDPALFRIYRSTDYYYGDGYPVAEFKPLVKRSKELFKKVSQDLLDKTLIAQAEEELIALELHCRQEFTMRKLSTSRGVALERKSKRLMITTEEFEEQCGISSIGVEEFSAWVDVPELAPHPLMRV